jgi:hypothetical protein
MDAEINTWGAWRWVLMLKQFQMPVEWQVFVPGRVAISETKGAMNIVSTIRRLIQFFCGRLLTTAEMLDTWSRSKRYDVGVFHAKTRRAANCATRPSDEQASNQARWDALVVIPLPDHRERRRGFDHLWVAFDVGGVFDAFVTKPNVPTPTGAASLADPQARQWCTGLAEQGLDSLDFQVHSVRRC